MKRNRLSLILLSLLITLSILGFFPIKGLSSANDLDYTFEKDILYNEINPTADFGLNIRNHTIYTQTYNATYSFTDDFIGNNQTDIDFIDSISGGYAQIVENIGNHDMVLRFSVAVGFEGLKHTISQATSGFKELWVRTEDATDYTQINFYEGATSVIFISIYNDQFHYYDVEVEQHFGTAIDNVWYHFGIEWFADDTYDFYLDGALIESGMDTYDPQVAGVDTLQFRIQTVTSYFDGIGFLSDPYYNRFDNVIPISYENETLEVDKWEFFNNEDGSLTYHAQQDIPYWSELDTLGYITKNIDNVDDETGVYFPIASATHQGIEKTIDVSTTTIKEFYLKFIWGVPGSTWSKKYYQYFDIDSYDDTLVCRLRIDDNAVLGDFILSYYDGASYVQLEDLPSFAQRIYSYDIIISHNAFVSLNFSEWSYETGLYENSNIYNFPIITLNKDGIGDVKFDAVLEDTHVAQWGVAIDSIGVYADNSSQSNDFGNYYYATNKDFNNKYQNFFTLSANGFFGCSMTSFEMGQQVFTLFTYQNASEFSWGNFADKTEKFVENAYFTVITNTTYNLTSVLIEGSKLTEGINEYNIYLECGGVDVDNSYFYVEDNRLRFQLTADDDNIEYIQARIDIDNVLSENRSVRFGSDINGDSYGYFRLSYTDNTSTVLPMPSHATTTALILPQEKNIMELIILITDNDYRDSGSTTGYVINVKLIYYPDIETSITTLSLLVIIIPLIILLVPTFALYKKFGEGAIIPMFLLMTVVCLATALIPTWLFFVIIMASVVFLFTKRKMGAIN